MKKSKSKTSSRIPFIILAIACLVTVSIFIYSIFARELNTSNGVLDTGKSQDLIDFCYGVPSSCVDSTPKTTEPIVEDVKKDDVDSASSAVIDSDIESVINDDIPGESTDHTFGTGLTINFPADWKIEHTKRLRQHLNDEPFYESNDRTLLTSPDGLVTVKFELIMQGPHGGPKYDIGSYYESELIMLDYEFLPNYPNLYFASYLTEHDDIGSKYYVGVNSAIELMRGLRVGDEVDVLLYREINSVSRISERVIVLWLEARFNNLSANPSENDFVALKSTKDYEVVKQIIESLHIKK